jgi:hypothetical protein
MADPWTPVATLIWTMLTKLVGAYGTQRREFFTKHVEPLQDQMLSIHKDYISGFEEARKLIRTNAAPDGAVWEFLRERRRDNEAERQLAQSVASELEKARRRFFGDSTWVAVEDYCRSVIDYFTASSEPGGLSWYSNFLDMVEGHYRITGRPKYSFTGFSTDPRRDLLEALDYTLDYKLPGAFKDVSNKYAHLRSILL